MEILCGGCGKTLAVDDGHVEQDLPCPHCGRLIRISAMDGDGTDERLLAPLEAKDDLADDFLTKAKLALKKKLLVVCGSCGERLTVQQKLAGKMARCPACGKQIRVPAVAEDREPIEPTELMTDVGAESPGTLDLAGRADAVPVPAALADAAATATAPTARPVTPPRMPRRRGRRRKPTNLAVWLLLASLGTGLGGVIIGYVLWGRGSRPEPILPPGHRPIDRPEPPKPDPWAMRPAPPTPPPVEPRPGPVPTAPEPTGTATLPTLPDEPDPDAKPELEIVRAKLDVLAGASGVPAPAGKAFLRATVRISAGSEAATVDTRGVTLQTGDGEIPTLGVPAPEQSFAVGGRRQKMTIPPAASRMETFLFVVPPDLPGGKIRIAGVGELLLPKLKPLARPARDKLPGLYVEAARFLKLSFDDAVMEAVRSAPRQRVMIRPEENHFQVSILRTPIRGRATPEPDGSYKVVLAEGAKALTGRLRLLEGGRGLVLYLADGPYHQVVYDRR